MFGASLLENFGARRVLVTGHTGFKGGWLTLWLNALGARVTGFALPPDGAPSMFERCGIADACEHVIGDIREPAAVDAVLARCRPEVVFHLAAQPLVRRSYADPVETFSVNVLGTAHLLDAIRRLGLRCAVVVVTSDKCYENQEWEYGYRETDPMGGHDPYSASKGAAELVTASFRRSFFAPTLLARHGVALATARAGNVIGGGDWSADRIFPDVVRALAESLPVRVRNPAAVRPWQHVLEPLAGYLTLGARLLSENGAGACCEPWNFGPAPESCCTVRLLVETAIGAWGSGTWIDASDGNAPHEARTLRLAIDKSVARLGWQPRWSLAEAVGHTVEWYRTAHEGARPETLRELTERQIRAYTA